MMMLKKEESQMAQMGEVLRRERKREKEIERERERELVVHGHFRALECGFSFGATHVQERLCALLTRQRKKYFPLPISTLHPLLKDAVLVVVAGHDIRKATAWQRAESFIPCPVCRQTPSPRGKNLVYVLKRGTYHSPA